MAQTGIPRNLLRYFEDTINQITPLLRQDYLAKKKAVETALHRLLVVSNENWLEYQNTGSFGSSRLGIRRRLEQDAIKRELLSTLNNVLRERYEIYQMQRVYWDIDILGGAAIPPDQERDERMLDEVNSKLNDLMKSRPVQRHIQSMAINKIYNEMLVHLFLLKDAQYSYDWVQTTNRAQFKKCELFRPTERKAYRRWVISVGDRLTAQPTDADKCSICLESYGSDPRHILSCRHMFHQRCITAWMKINPICPLCRLPVSSEAVVCSFV
jgi:hypothetical protein